MLKKSRTGILGVVAILSGSCSSAPGIVVSVENWPATSPYLLIGTTFNDMPAHTIRVPAGQPRFVVRLPAGQAGVLVLNANAIDDTGCKIAQGQLSTNIGGGLHPTTEGTLQLSPVEPALCTLSVQIESGTGTISSTPSGISCSPAAGICEGDFPRGTTVHMLPAASDYKSYPAWTSNCAGYYTCDIHIDRNASAAISFIQRQCSVDGWCNHYRVDPNGVPITETTATLRAIELDDNGVAWAFGDYGTVIRCNDSVCTKIMDDSSNIRLFRAIKGDDGAVWSAQYYDSGLILRCKDQTCTKFADLYTDNLSIDCKGAYFQDTSEMRVQGGYLWTNIGKSIFRASIANPIGNCVNIGTAPSGPFSGLYVANNTAWSVSDSGTGTGNATSVQCVGSACMQQAQGGSLPAPSVGLDGNNGLVWLGSSSALVQCALSDMACLSVKQAGVPIAGNPGIITDIKAANDAVWATGAQNKVAYYQPSTAKRPTALTRTAANLPPADQPPLRHWYWADSKEMFLVGDPGKIEDCNPTACKAMEAGTTSSIKAMAGSATDVWAAGDKGSIVHYRRP